MINLLASLNIVGAANNLVTGLQFKPNQSQLVIYSRYKIQKVFTYHYKKKRQYVIDLGKVKVSTKIKSELALRHHLFKKIIVERKSRTTQIILVYHHKPPKKIFTKKTNNRITLTWQSASQSEINLIRKLELSSSLSELLKIECTHKVPPLKLYYSNEPNRMIIDVFNSKRSRKLKRNWVIQNDVLQSIQIRNYRNKVRIILNFNAASSSDYKVYRDNKIITIIPKPGVVFVQTLNQMIENLRFKTDLTLKYGRDIKRDDAYEASRDIRLLFDGGLKYTWAPQNFLKAGFRFRYIEEYDPKLYTLSDSRFSETYLNFVGDFLRLGVGYQTVRWGRTDEFSPIDIINPEDLTEFYVNTRPERKMPVPLVRASWFNDWFNIEGVYVPWFFPSLVIYRDSDWAFFDHVVDHLVTQLGPFGERLNELNFQENIPEGNLQESQEGGLRLTKTFNNFDVGLTYYYGRDKFPLIQPRTINGYLIAPAIFNPGALSGLMTGLPPTFFSLLDKNDVSYDLFYHRFEMYGFDMEAAFWNIGFRTEIAYFKDRDFQQTIDLNVVEKNQIHYVVGFDHFVWDNFYVNLLFSYAEILEFDQNLLNAAQTQMDLAGTISWEMVRDVYALEISGSYNLDEDSLYLTPLFLWRQSPNLEFELGAFYILAEDDSMAARLKGNNQFFIKGRFHF